MSIQSEIDRIKGNVTDSLSAIRGTGVNVPDGSNSNDLPNLINELANTRQRVVDLGALTARAITDNYVEVALTPEQVMSIFYDELPPVIVFTNPKGKRISLSSPYTYSKTDSVAVYSLSGLMNANPEDGFSGLIQGFLYINNLNLYYGNTTEFVVDYDSAIFTVPIQLPADPTSALQAATKQYVDDKTDDAITTNSGGVVNMGQSIGAGPYTIEMTEEEEGDLTAAQVGYNNVATGMTATDVQSAITELFTSASEGKALVAAAVTGKGVQTAADASYEQIAANVTAIETGGVEAVPVTITMGGPSSIDLYYTKVLEDGSLSFTNGQATMSNALTDNMPSGSVIVGFVNYTHDNATSSTGATISKRYEPGTRLDTTIVWVVD